MSIKFNQLEKTIEIREQAKTFYQALKFLFMWNIVMAIISLARIPDYGFQMPQFAFLFIGTVSLIALLFMNTRSSSIEKIPLEQLKGFSEMSILGLARQFVLVLEDGSSAKLLVKEGAASTKAREALSKATK